MHTGRIEEPELFFGRVYEPDDRDARFPMRLALGTQWPKTLARKWTTGPTLDQKRTSSCVGHGWKAFLMSTPIRSTVESPPSAMEIYDTARRIDADPTNDHRDTGTSVRAGVQFLQAQGHIRSYLWASSLDDVIHWLLTRGTVVIGVPWYDGMKRVDGAGFIHAEGQSAGGHCTLLYGADRRVETTYLQNSWGDSWGGWDGGNGGRCKLSFSDLDLLLRQDGEAVTAVERLVAAA